MAISNKGEQEKISSEPANTAPATGGVEITREYPECRAASTHSRIPREPSVRGATARERRVTGAPNAHSGGTIIIIAMCWTMWASKRNLPQAATRSEERRVVKECGSRSRTDG